MLKLLMELKMNDVKAMLFARPANAYEAQHNERVRAPRGRAVLFVETVQAMSLYLDECDADFADEDEPYKISTDRVLGPEVEAILRGLHGLLNGTTGCLDAGKVQSALAGLSERAGFNLYE